ncbi:hypothetical protein [Paraburkholderia phenoliruptrix]|uniref:hypothetical protein n=1 Tax=Paraburkholderia phenoliruptrix TaxID=252970 RepID=UPI0028699C00|nr:hypothetical protein [Paraburkholderia phenoliruptrix]WMY06561.1 hypothetical protein P3F88_09570 [Paraburkholderia phenoliruptrix]
MSRATLNVCRLAAGQIALQDLHARSAVVAVEGDLQLAFRDHSLAWLCDAVPFTPIMLREGQCFVLPQRGVVSISAARAEAVAFALQASQSAAKSRLLPGHVARQLAALVRATLRRAA